VRYLSLEEVLYLHSRIIKRSGGKTGVRDLGLLDAAIHRPATSFGGEDLYPTVFLKAAALMHSLALNHPFVDGNKRTAFGAPVWFLRVNGYRLRPQARDVIDTLIHLEKKDLDLDAIATWLKQRSRRLG
jgi:death-on-curing protein